MKSYKQFKEELEEISEQQLKVKKNKDSLTSFSRVKDQFEFFLAIIERDEFPGKLQFGYVTKNKKEFAQDNTTKGKFIGTRLTAGKQLENIIDLDPQKTNFIKFV